MSKRAKKNKGKKSNGSNKTFTKSNESAGINSKDERDNISGGLRDRSVGVGGKQLKDSNGSSLRDINSRAKEAVRPNVRIDSSKPSGINSITIQESSSGPIPHPDIMYKYDKILPGSRSGFFV